MQVEKIFIWEKKKEKPANFATCAMTVTNSPPVV